MAVEKPEIHAIFNEAIAQPLEEERVRYLDQVCRDDVQARARVEALLRRHSEAGGFFGGKSPAAVATEIRPLTETPGTQIGPYKLLQQIGEGGMGTVYMAEQTAPVQRTVALKLIKAGMDSRQVIARFEAERQALALMDHPHIAKVLDAGTTDSGLPYFVMELVKGVPVTKYCDEHHLTPRQRLELFIPVCQAVQHAHQKGIIHRDLKPSNVLVALYDGQPVPKVIDFGVAKATGQKLTERTMYTEFGAIVGTLEYMSPEQAESNQLDIDTRSDIYSLGVLLYELLTGTTPFEKKRLKDAALMEVLRIIREDEPQKPSTRLSTTDELPSISANRGLEPKKLSDQVRGDLDWIVMKALEKDRNRRYESASGFVLDIQRYLADEPVLASPPSAVYRLRKFARRNKVTLTFASLSLLFIVVLGSGVGWMARDRTAREEKFARQQIAREQEFDRARITREQEFSRQDEARNQEIARKRQESETALNREVDRALEEADRLGEQEKWPDAHDAVERAEKLLASAGRSDRPPHLVALQKDLTMAQRLEDIYRNPQRDPTRGAPSDTIEFAPAGLDHDPQRDPASSSVMVPMPVRGGMAGRLQPAEVSAEEEIFMGREQDARFDAAFQEFGIDADALEPPEAAARIGRTAIRAALVKALDDWAAMRRRARGDNDAGWKKLVEIARLADRDEWRNRFREALLVRGRQALETLAAEVSPQDAPPATLLLLAETLKQLGALESGMSVLVQAQQQYPDDLWLNDALASMSESACQPPRYADALRFYTVASALRPRSARWHKALASLHYQSRSFDQAIGEHSRVIELKPEDAGAWNGRGWCYSNLQQSDKATVDFSKAIELKPDDAGFWHSRANYYCYHLRQWDKALADYSKAIELRPDEASGWLNRATCYRNLGQRDESAADCSKAIELYFKVIERRPDDANAWHARGQCYAILQEWDKALADYSKAIELKPDRANTWYARGWCYLSQQEWDKALADYSNAIELKPDDANAWYDRGWCYSNLQQWDKAQADYSKTIELKPDNARGWSGRADCYRYLGQRDKSAADYAKAIERFSTAIEQRPDDADTWHNRGSCYFNLQQWDKALADYSRHIELKPDDADAWSNRGVCYTNLRQWDKALADFAKAIELKPDDLETWSRRGDCYLNLQQWDKAAADYSKAIELKPNEARAWYGRGVTYQYRMEPDKALSDFAKAIELDPKSAERHNNVAWFLVTWPDPNLRNPATGLALATKAVELAPEEAGYRNTLGVAQYRAGDWKAAIEALNKSIELQNGGVAYDWFFLAMAHWRQGNHDEARRWYDKAAAWRQQNAKDNEELQRFDAEAKELLEINDK